MPLQPRLQRPGVQMSAAVVPARPPRPRLGHLFASPLRNSVRGGVFQSNHAPLAQRPVTARAYSIGTPPSSASSPVSRAERILARLPPSMQKYTRRLKDAPVSHVVAFLILHEITAVVPLFGLFGLFHYAGSASSSSSSSSSSSNDNGSKFVPLDYMMDHYGAQVADGVRRFEKYFRRKGWFGFGQDDGASVGDAIENTESSRGSQAADEAAAEATVRQRWASADAKYRIVVEVGLAYAITKVLLPVRIAASLWATPWFAGVLARVRSLRPRKKLP